MKNSVFLDTPTNPVTPVPGYAGTYSGGEFVPLDGFVLTHENLPQIVAVRTETANLTSRKAILRHFGWCVYCESPSTPCECCGRSHLCKQKIAHQARGRQ